MSGEALDLMEPGGPAEIYTSLVTVWLMILQRLGGGLSMQAVLKDALSQGEFFPDRKRVREGTLSSRDTAFSDARQRLSLASVEQLLEVVSRSLIATSAGTGTSARAAGDERLEFIVDGTTLTTAPSKELKAAFPPADNPQRPSVWPTVLMLVAHELRSGCAMVPEIGAMYGAENTSEHELFQALCQRLPPASILLGDVAFGVFGTAWDAVQAGHAFAFRLNTERFGSLHRDATPLSESGSESGPGASYELTWKPTRKNRTTRPDLPTDARLDVLLHEVPFAEVLPGCDTAKTLYLVTTRDISRARAIALYLRRYDIEHDIRDVKVTLNTERIRAQSREMFLKELLTSLVAYNLVIQFRREAAAQAQVRPRQLSFTGVWNTFQSFFLKLSPANTPAEWQARYNRALDIASRELLRHRPGRSFPRKAHHRRPKATHTQKAAAKKTKKNTRKKPP